MSKRTKEITTENFSEAIDYAYTINKKMTANLLSFKIILPLGSILFALHSMLLCLGALSISVYDKPDRLIAFNALPFIQKYWNGVWDFFSSFTDLLYLKIILMVVFLFFVPFVISSVAAIIIFYTTKGKKPVIEGNTAKKAKELYTYLKNAPRTYFEAFDGKPVVWRRVCGIVSGIGVMIFMFYFYGAIITQNSNFLSALLALSQSNKHGDEIILSIICGGLFYVLFVILHYVFTKMIQPYCDSYYKWQKFKDKVEAYWLSVDKEECKRREEEASREKYDGWKYKNLTKTQYYKDKKEEYYAKYMGYPYESDEDKAKKLVIEVEEDLSGGGWGDY